MKQIINTTGAPAAIGPYSQAVKANGFLFVSGQVPFDPATMQIVEGVEAQTRRVMDSLKAHLNIFRRQARFPDNIDHPLRQPCLPELHSR